MSGSSFQQQVLNAAGDLAQSVTVPLLGFLWSWIKRIIPLFVVLMVVMSLALSGYTFFRQQRDRQLKFSVSPGKISGADQVDLIERKLREEQSFWGPNYLVTEITTGGSLDNLRNVGRDQDGNAIGIAVDGLSLDKNDKKDVFTLVPLQWCYLHFVVRSDSLTHIGFSRKELSDRGEQPVTLTEWAAKYRLAKANKSITDDIKKWPVRIYLGQANSGTRQIAEQVLTNAGIKPAELEPSYYIADAEEIPEQLARYHIDGAFVLEPLPCGVLKTIAANNRTQCTLISIDSAKDLLPEDNSIVSSKIPPYTYSFTQPQPLDTEASHLGPVESLATRRLVVASTRMSDNDAYYLANCVMAALPREQISRPDKNGRWHGPNQNQIDDSRDYPPSYDVHPGVELNLVNGPGISWFNRHVSWLGPLLLAMTLSLITELKNRIPAWLAVRQPPSPPPKDGDTVKGKQPRPDGPAVDQAQPRDESPKERPAEYTEIESRLEALYLELMDAYDGSETFSKSAIAAWEERLELLLRQIHPLRRARKLTRNDVEALNQVGFKLRRMLESLRQQLSPGPTKASSESTGASQKDNAGSENGA